MESSGSYRIRSADPFESAEVDLILLGATSDIWRGRRRLEAAFRVSRQLPTEFGATVVDPTDSTEQAIRNNAEFSTHFVGAARVGEVTRPDLTVRRVKDLRVVDASAMGDIPTSAV